MKRDSQRLVHSNERDHLGEKSLFMVKNFGHNLSMICAFMDKKIPQIITLFGLNSRWILSFYLLVDILDFTFSVNIQLEINK